MVKKIYHYYVECEDEQSVINVLKSDMQCIENGKVEKFNIIQEYIKPMRLRTFKDNTIVVLVYDTDVENQD